MPRVGGYVAAAGNHESCEPTTDMEVESLGAATSVRGSYNQCQGELRPWTASAVSAARRGRGGAQFATIAISFCYYNSFFCYIHHGRAATPVTVAPFSLQPL